MRAPGRGHEVIQWAKQAGLIRRVGTDDEPAMLEAAGVYVRFIGGLAGNETYQDDIILDQTAPKILSATTVRKSRPDTPAARKRSRERVIALRVQAKDNVSGVAAIQVTQNRRLPPAWKKYDSRKRYRFRPRGATSRRIYARVRDRAANPSKWRRVRRPRRR